MDTTFHPPRLFDYFIVCGLQQKPDLPKSSKSRYRQKPTYSPNAPNLPYEPVLLYVYNANSASPSRFHDQSTSPSTEHTTHIHNPYTSTTTTTTATGSPSAGTSHRYRDRRLSAQQKLEESEVLVQVPRHCYCDLSDLINRYHRNTLHLRKYVDSGKYSRQMSFNSQLRQNGVHSFAPPMATRTSSNSVSSSSSSTASTAFDSAHFSASGTHKIQFERFSFLFRDSAGRQRHGHCRRIFYNAGSSPSASPSKGGGSRKAKVLLPTTLCVVSSYPFTALFEQILDVVITKWLFDDHESIFLFLSNILLHTPSLGDTFRVSLNRRDRRRPLNVAHFSDSVPPSPHSPHSPMTPRSPSTSRVLHNKKGSHSQDDLNNTITLKLASSNRPRLQPLFQALSVDNILFCISCILTEQKLIFISSELPLLSDCILALAAVIYPFRWQHLCCPVLSECALNLFTSPFPFMVGIKRYLANHLDAVDTSGVVVVDLDSQKVFEAANPHDIPWSEND